MEREQLRVDGLRTPVFDTAPGEADEAIVFVHGNPGSSRDWDDLAARTAVLARSVGFDMPGFGQADKPDAFDHSVGGYARFVDGILARLGVRRAHLVLHDLGGPWGLEWAAMHPARFASATLINTGVFLDYRWHRAARIWQTPVLGEIMQALTTRTAFRLALREGNPRGLPREFVDRMYRDYDRETRRAVLKTYRAMVDADGIGRRHVQALAPLRRPALVVWGRCDPYLPPELAGRQREVFPDAAIVMLERSGHWPFVDDAPRVGDSVIAFLRRAL